MSAGATARLDAFTDAAFAIAVSLLILAGTGFVSILVSLTPFGEFAYSTLPLTIGLFVKRHDWTGGPPDGRSVVTAPSVAPRSRRGWAGLVRPSRSRRRPG